VISIPFCRNFCIHEIFITIAKNINFSNRWDSSVYKN
jgi:hypothetical protein